MKETMDINESNFESRFHEKAVQAADNRPLVNLTEIYNDLKRTIESSISGHTGQVEPPETLLQTSEKESSACTQSNSEPLRVLRPENQDEILDQSSPDCSAFHTHPECCTSQEAPQGICAPQQNDQRPDSRQDRIAFDVPSDNGTPEADDCKDETTSDLVDRIGHDSPGYKFYTALSDGFSKTYPGSTKLSFYEFTQIITEALRPLYEDYEAGRR